MGTRVVFEIMVRGLAAPVAILFANYSHPDVEPVHIFETVVTNGQNRTDILDELLGFRYETAGGNHRANDRIFSIVEAPYGDYEFIMRLDMDGNVVRIENEEG